MNANKTKIVVFRKGGKLAANHVWYYGGSKADIVKSFKYLSYTLSPSGSFANCFQDLTNSALRALFAIKVELLKIRH